MHILNSKTYLTPGVLDKGLWICILTMSSIGILPYFINCYSVQKILLMFS